MKRIATAAALLCATVALAAEPAKPAEAAKGPADTSKALYAVGVSVSKSLEPFALTPAELELVVKGIRDGVAGKPTAPFDETAQNSIQQLVQARLGVAAEKEKARGSEHLRKAAAEKGAVKTASGLVYRELKAGAGAMPAASSKVKVHYAGRLVDGKEFDSSVKRGQPAEFQLDQVIKCWTEGVAKMKVGGKAELTCPADIAYGAAGRPPVIPGNAVLVFEVELLDIVK
jgi:FKBP-type peptidyl-prolyl cis-trans isomerase